MIKNTKIKLTDEVIQELFGYEDAESESVERLKAYFIKNTAYERVRADLPVRILVGHKGTGKSALFKVAMSEDRDDCEGDIGKWKMLLRPLIQIAKLQ